MIFLIVCLGYLITFCRHIWLQIFQFKRVLQPAKWRVPTCAGEHLVNWKKKLNWLDPLNPRPVIWDNPQSPVFFLICPPSLPLPPSSDAQPVIFSFVVWVLVKRFKVSRITAVLASHPHNLKQRLLLEGSVVVAAVLHERETESWQRLFDIYEEFIQRSGTCPWIFRMRGVVISTELRALVMLLHLIEEAALFKAKPISFVDRTAWMLIGFVLTLAWQKVQANADAGGNVGEGGSGRLQL